MQVQYIVPKVERARDNFRLKAGHKFKYDHCYEVLKDLPKYSMSTTGSQYTDEEDNVNPLESNDSETREFNNPLKRPEGRKTAKLKGKKRATANSAATQTLILENSDGFNKLYDKNSAESQSIKRTLNEKIDGLISIRTKEYEAQL